MRETFARGCVVGFLPAVVLLAAVVGCTGDARERASGRPSASTSPSAAAVPTTTTSAGERDGIVKAPPTVRLAETDEFGLVVRAEQSNGAVRVAVDRVDSLKATKESAQLRAGSRRLQRPLRGERRPSDARLRPRRQRRHPAGEPVRRRKAPADAAPDWLRLTQVDGPDPPSLSSRRSLARCRARFGRSASVMRARTGHRALNRLGPSGVFSM
jgi:hypothetical protein